MTVKKGFAITILLTMVFTTCRQSEERLFPCAINTVDESEFHIRISRGNNPTQNPPVYAFLSGSVDGTIIQVEELGSVPVTIGSSCSSFDAFDLTFLRVWEDSSTGRVIYDFKTYVDVPNQSNFVFDSETNFGVTRYFELQINGIQSLEKFGTNQGLIIGNETELNDSTFLIDRVPSLYYCQYIKLWADNNSPRYAIIRNVSDFKSIDYDNMLLFEDTTKIRLPNQREWLYHIEGVFDEDDPTSTSRVRLEEQYISGTEPVHEITVNTPSVGLDGYLMYLTGRDPLNSNSWVTYRKYYEELPNYIPMKEFSVNITRDEDFINVAPIADAALIEVPWFTHRDDEKYISWNVIGAASTGMNFKKLSIPQNIKEQYLDLNNYEMQSVNSADVYFHDQISSYQEYLEAIYSGDLNTVTTFLLGQEYHHVVY